MDCVRHITVHDGWAPMFQIAFTPEAVDDLKAFRKHEQQQILTAIENQLSHQADQETRNRKRLRPNQLAEWELRVGDFRVFYDIEPAETEQADNDQAETEQTDNDQAETEQTDAAQRNAVVKIEAVGYKQGNKLFVHGEEYEL